MKFKRGLNIIQLVSGMDKENIIKEVLDGTVAQYIEINNEDPSQLVNLIEINKKDDCPVVLYVDSFEILKNLNKTQLKILNLVNDTENTVLIFVPFTFDVMTEHVELELHDYILKEEFNLYQIVPVTDNESKHILMKCLVKGNKVLGAKGYVPFKNAWDKRLFHCSMSIDHLSDIDSENYFYTKGNYSCYIRSDSAYNAKGLFLIIINKVLSIYNKDYKFIECTEIFEQDIVDKDKILQYLAKEASEEEDID